MQLSTLVLPAPLGPMSAKSSFGSTEKDTSSSTVNPPKRKLKSWTSRSAIPPPRSAILLDVPVRTAIPVGLSEIELLHVLVALQSIAITIQDDPAVPQNVGIVSDLQGRRGALLDQQNSDPKLITNDEQLAGQVVNRRRRETQRKLVHEQQLRPAHERCG